MNKIKTIIGSPGTGKTTYLLNILEDLLKVYPPEEIAFVSFTKKGTYEGAGRARKKFGLKEKEIPYFRTLHSIAFKQLDIGKDSVMNKRRYKEFSEGMGMYFVGYYTEDLKNNDDRYLFLDGLYKNNPEYADIVLNNDTYVIKWILNNVIHNYERYKKEKTVWDFTDMIMDFIKQGKPLPVKAAIIDEAQDLTPLQWKFAEVAFKNCDIVYIAGDDDQALFQWSGADVNKFLSYQKPETMTILDKSWRLKENILNIANSVSSKIETRVHKVFAPVSEGGNVVYCNSIEEIRLNSEETYYFLCRNRVFLKAVENYLRSLGVLFETRKGLSVKKTLYRAIKHYEQVRRDYPDELGNRANDFYEYVRRDIDISQNLPWYEAFSLSKEDELYIRELLRNKVSIEEDTSKITVQTIHGVKGGEADNVVLLLSVTDTIGCNLIDSLDSELRCLYTGITRAKKNLYLVQSTSRYSFEDFLFTKKQKT